jgi:hypothetical protein
MEKQRTKFLRERLRTWSTHSAHTRAHTHMHTPPLPSPASHHPYPRRPRTTSPVCIHARGCGVWLVFFSYDSLSMNAAKVVCWFGHWRAPPNPSVDPLFDPFPPLPPTFLSCAVEASHALTPTHPAAAVSARLATFAPVPAAPSVTPVQPATGSLPHHTPQHSTHGRARCSTEVRSTVAHVLLDGAQPGISAAVRLALDGVELSCVGLL